MLLSKKGLYFLVGITVLHSLILFSVFHGSPPLISGIPWGGGETLSFPFAISRAWDLLLFPLIFLFWGLCDKSGWWKSDSWDSEDEGLILGHVFPLFAAITIAGLYLGDCGCADTASWFNTFPALLKVAYISCLVLWIICMLIGDALVATYIAGFMFFEIGAIVAFGAGLPYFILLSLPAAVIVLFISPKGKEWFLPLKQKIQAYWEKKNEVKRIARAALKLDVSAKTKQKIIAITDEIPELQKEIKRLRGLIKEIEINLRAVISQLAVAETSALKKDVDECVAAASKAVADSLLRHKESLEGLLSEYRMILAEKEEKMEEFLKLLACAHEEARFCWEYDFLAKTAMETQKRVKDLLEKIASDLK